MHTKILVGVHKFVNIFKPIIDLSKQFQTKGITRVGHIEGRTNLQ